MKRPAQKLLILLQTGLLKLFQAGVSSFWVISVPFQAVGVFSSSCWRETSSTK